MKDRHHDDAMAELLRDDPELAAAVLSAAEADGDQAELVIVRRQAAKAELALTGKSEQRP
jgi:DNA-binding phage protein